MKPKVLFTASVYVHLSNFHRPYLRRFRERGWEVHIACGSIPAGADLACDRMISLPLQKSMTAPDNLWAMGILRRLMAEERYELVACHTSLAAFFTRLAAKGLGKNRPTILNMVHGYLFDDCTPRLRRRLLLGAEQLTAPETDYLLTMNRWDYDLAAERHLGRHIAAIPGVGVDYGPIRSATAAQGEDLRRRLGLGPENYLLVYGAEFSPRKSQETLLRSLPFLPEQVALALPGSGELWENCRALAAEKGVSGRVFFPGQVGDMPVWYRAADAAVSASRSEGLPFNLMEAMAAGLPVVASDVKGHRDLICPGETGLLYPYGDGGAFASCVRQLLDEPETGRALGANAARAAERYGLETVFPQVMALYAAAAGDAALSEAPATVEMGSESGR